MLKQAWQEQGDQRKEKDLANKKHLKLLSWDCLQLIIIVIRLFHSPLIIWFPSTAGNKRRPSATGPKCAVSPGISHRFSWSLARKPSRSGSARGCIGQVGIPSPWSLVSLAAFRTSFNLSEFSVIRTEKTRSSSLHCSTKLTDPSPRSTAGGVLFWWCERAGTSSARISHARAPFWGCSRRNDHQRPSADSQPAPAAICPIRRSSLRLWARASLGRGGVRVTFFHCAVIKSAMASLH